MATLLYRLGRFSFRRAWMIIGAWVVLAVIALGAGVALGGRMQESFAIPGTESQQAIDRLAAVFPQTAGASAQIVLQTPAGNSLTEHRVVIDRVADELTALAPISQALSPFSEYATDAIAGDGRTGIMQLQFTDSSETVSDAALEQVDAVAAQLRDDGLTIAFGGMLYQNVEYGVTVTELIGVLVAGIVMFVTFGSVLAAGMPLLSAIAGLAISMGGVLAVAAFTTISNATPMLALMIGLAVGIDYGLFILSRHRRQLAEGLEPAESTGLAVGTAGSAVVFAGLTVVIALLGLLVVGIPFLSAMGIAAAAAVALAVLASVTLLPALFGVAGRRLAPKPGSRAARLALAADDARPSFGTRWVRLVMRAPWVAIVGVVGVLGVLAVPSLSMQLALPGGATEATGSTARIAYDTISAEFTEGRNGPLVVAVDVTQTDTVLETLDRIADELRDLDGVETVGAGLPNPSVDTAIIQVIPITGPERPETAALVQQIRDLAPSMLERFDTEIFVTGATAVQIDISQRLNDALLPFGIIVVGLSIVLLMMVFRSLLVPVKAALGFVLSVVASFGVVVTVFQWGIGADLLGITPGPVLSFMPILLMAVLFGLAMDYEVFLVSGMRERYVHGASPRAAIEHGFTGAARVVTAAALIMFFVFFAFVPEGAGVIKVIALGLAVGVFFDAFLVRMTLVPAIMTLMGRWAWWLPRGLARALPDVDIEGERLKHHRESVEWAAGQTDAAVSADGLVAVAGADVLAPVHLRVPSAGIGFVVGATAERRAVLLTIAGRLRPLGGRAQVLGHPLPTDALQVTRMVAVGEATPVHLNTTLTPAELLRERSRLQMPWRPGIGRRRLGERLRALASVLGSAAVTAPVAGLTPTQRAIALGALALSEDAPVIAFDLGGLDSAEIATTVGALVSSAPVATTLLFGVPRGAEPPRTVGGREAVVIRVPSGGVPVDGAGDESVAGRPASGSTAATTLEEAR